MLVPITDGGSGSAPYRTTRGRPSRRERPASGGSQPANLPCRRGVMLSMAHNWHAPHEQPPGERGATSEPAPRVDGRGAAGVLALQRSAGNQSVVAWLSRTPAPAP